jgi:glycosyltransferase involved in cell wall biosynthesis
MRGVHLFVPMLHRHDAVGEHTLAVHQAIVAAGMTSTIYSEIPDPNTADLTRPYRDYEKASQPDDVLVYQFATQSKIAGWLLSRPERLVLNYHSLTPPSFFARWNDGIARLQTGALIELEGLASRAGLGIAVSRFDQEELRRAGCANTVVIPVANVADPPVTPDAASMERLARREPGQGLRWLSVGRLAPNKSHQSAIAALFVTRKTSDPNARLTIVGSPTEPAYAGALARYAASLGLARSVDFVSGISEGELAAFYRSSDVLVMLSDHEGFGVPLVEAMGHGLPIVAFDEGAVTEVVGPAAVVLATKQPETVSRAIADLARDPDTRARLVEAGRSRFAELGLAGASGRFIDAIATLDATSSPRS